jgi:bifunctional oligoribonuclease and PAP phosphatase NrnA
VKFDEGFVYAIITKADIEKFNMTDEEAAANVNLLGGIEGYNFWFLAIEYDYEIRLRLRASGIEIDKLANMYNGGGHKMAAGAKLKSLDELDGFLASARKYLKEYK